MSNLSRALQLTRRRALRQDQAATGKPTTLWSDAHSHTINTLIPNPALLPCVPRTTDAQDDEGNFFATPGWDD